jgi:hypothetical protein
VTHRTPDSSKDSAVCHDCGKRWRGKTAGRNWTRHIVNSQHNGTLLFGYLEEEATDPSLSEQGE